MSAAVTAMARGRGTVPPRPYLPPVAATAVGTLLAAGLGMEAGWRGLVRPAEALPPLAMLACCGIVALVCWLVPVGRSGLRRYARWAVAGILIGTMATAVHLSIWRAGARAIRGRSVSTLSLTVTGDPSVSSFGAQMDARVVGGDGSVLGDVSVFADKPIEEGTVMRAVGRIRPLGDDTWDRSRFMAGQLAQVEVVRVLETMPGQGTPLNGFRASVLTAIAPRESAAHALVAGIVCGRTTELAQTDASDAFARTGTSHLVAVSGSHLALVAGLVVRVASRTRARPALRTAVLSVVMGCYVVFTGGAPSAVRSLVMVVAALLTRLGGRRGHGLSGLSLAAIVLTLPNPGVVYDLGFELSAASVLFIQLFSRYVEALFARLRLPEGVSAALALTLVAQLATLPITLPVFGELSLIAPIANLVLGPLMTALLVCGLVTAPVAAVFPEGEALLAPAVALAQLCVFTATALASVPYAAIAVDATALGAAVWLPYALAAVVFSVWRLPTMRAVAIAGGAGAVCVVGIIVKLVWFAPAAVTVLDVGQADAILVRDGPSALLVDAGVDDTVVAALARNGVLHLDAVLVTHWDRDHWGGLPAILEAFPVGRLIVAEGAADAMPTELAAAHPPRASEVSRGDLIVVGGFTAEVVWPEGTVEGGENADSLVLDVTYRADGRRMDILLTGDSEAAQAERYAPAVGDIDVLKLGHHGSTASVSPRMLEELSPELAVASAGAGNAYGHPSTEAVDAVRDAGGAFLCTIEAGDIHLEPATGGVRVCTQRAA